METLTNKYGGCTGFTGTLEQAEEKLGLVREISLKAVKDGETKFFAAQAEPHPRVEGMFVVEHASYRPFARDEMRGAGQYCAGRAIRGTKEPVPPALIRIFPEIGGESFFIAEVECRQARYSEPFSPEPGVKWICRWEGGPIFRWSLSGVTDLSTSQIVALLELREGLDKDEHGRAEDFRIQGVEFGGCCWRVVWFVEAAERELIRRSLADLLNHPSARSTTWLAEHFDKGNRAQVEWLKAFLQGYKGLEVLRDNYPESPALEFAGNQPVTGVPEEWDWLPAIPAENKAIVMESFDTGPHFHLPTGEWVPVEKVPGGGYFRLREDGRMDIFLKRGSREIGDRGWMWVLISEEGIEAGIDPLDNYGGLRSGYTPISERIAKVIASIQ